MAPSNRDIEAALLWLAEAGADEAVSDQPVNRFVSVEPAAQREGARRSAAAEAASTRLAGARTEVRPAAVRPRDAAPPGDAIGRAQDIAAACNSLADLRASLEAFDGCPLKNFASKTVFSDGIPEKGIMLIGEAPGREEDLAGLPFVGRAGKLLDRMLAAIGLDRRTNVYITNVLNWRPPENRDPSPDEAATCLPFLRRHIELASPAIIVLLGAVAARHVMGRSDGIMRLRGKWLEYHVNGRMVPVMPTLHPAYLLRRAIDKRLAWRDLQDIAAKVNSLKLLEDRGAHG